MARHTNLLAGMFAITPTQPGAMRHDYCVRVYQRPRGADGRFLPDGWRVLRSAWESSIEHAQRSLARHGELTAKQRATITAHLMRCDEHGVWLQVSEVVVFERYGQEVA